MFKNSAENTPVKPFKIKNVENLNKAYNQNMTASLSNSDQKLGRKVKTNAVKKRSFMAPLAGRLETPI